MDLPVRRLPMKTTTESCWTSFRLNLRSLTDCASRRAWEDIIDDCLLVWDFYLACVIDALRTQYRRIADAH